MWMYTGAQIHNDLSPQHLQYVITTTTNINTTTIILKYFKDPEKQWCALFTANKCILMNPNIIQRLMCSKYILPSALNIQISG